MMAKHQFRLPVLTGALALMLGFAAAAPGQVSINAVASLPAGEATAPYPGQTFTAVDSNPNPPVTCCTWTSSGDLDGLTLDPFSGVLSGTPAAAGSFPFTVTAKDGTGANASLPLTLTVNAVPSISTATLSPGEVGVAFSQSLQVAGGTAPFTWTLTTAPPPAPGLALGATGGITGIPTSAGNFTFNVQVTDALGVTGAGGVSVQIIPAPSVSTASLSQGEVGVAYTQTLMVSGGAAPYTWSVASGSLPAWLTLNTSTGTLSAAQPQAGSFSFSVQVTDSASVTSPTQALTLTVIAAPTITPAALPNGEATAPYPQNAQTTLAATGGAGPPYTWAVTAGSLPAGLSLNPTTGAITGTPTTAGPFPAVANFTVTVTDSGGGTASLAFTITVTAGPSINPTALPQGEVTSPYSQTLSASGGAGPPYTWAVKSGSLSGLTLSAGGVLSGTPTSTGTLNFMVQVTDSAGGKGTLAFTLTIIAAPTITSPAALPQGTLGQTYPSLALAAIGGSQPYTWSVSGGSLATGLSLSAAGTITGTPTKAGAFNFTVQVKDSSETTATQAFTISIVPPTVPQVNVAGLLSTSPAGQQIPFSLSLASPYPLDIAGQITMSFQPDAIAPVVDPAMGFSSGGLTASYTIPANSTSAVPIALQTGTVSGTITLTFTLSAGGTQLPGFQSTITIPRSVPIIPSGNVKLVRTSAGFEIHVLAFSPARDLTEADLAFTAAPGATLQTTALTENLASVATAWYQSEGSAQYGSLLMLVLPITASQGSVDAVGSVSVVLKNAQGSGQSTTGTF
jgi:putative Ig domain-containing protein